MTVYVIVKHNPPTALDFADGETPDGISAYSDWVEAVADAQKLMEFDGEERWVAQLELPVRYHQR